MQAAFGFLDNLYLSPQEMSDSQSYIRYSYWKQTSAAVKQKMEQGILILAVKLISYIFIISCVIQFIVYISPPPHTHTFLRSFHFILKKSMDVLCNGCIVICKI